VRRKHAFVARFVDLLHFRQFRERVQRLAHGLAFHAADGDMHPDQRRGGEHEQHHEAALPDIRQVIQHPEQDRQQEATQAADHANHAADRPNLVGIINRDVLVDRRLAQAHEEAQHKNQNYEARDSRLQMEGNLAVYTAHDIVGRRIGQQERARRRMR
jgi:hypothetical protein